MFKLKEINHHAHKTLYYQLTPQDLNNQIFRYSTSKHLSYRTFLNIHHKIYFIYIPVYLSDLSRFMIASYQSNSIWISYF